ncbi:MAG TPA: NADH-quinone oxidoreductase subunit N, partial [Anaerolineae bacterium]|nr:NADH-quinone oxidoreductase subunit N [Anaerolineae bacterium]
MDFQVPSINLVIIAPVIIVLGGAILAMVVDLFVDKDKKSWAAWVALVTLLAALAQTAGMWGFSGGTFIPEGGTPMIVVDNYATFLNITLILTGILAVLISVGFLRRNGLDKPEYYMLLLFSLGGMMLMGMANDLILVFLALEVLSIPLYILSGFAWPRPESEEAAMKYFILGAFSSAIFVFGIALAYGATGTTSLPGIFAAIDVNEALGLTAVAFLLVGFAFKVAAVPFHMWTPDVYEGAPTTVTAFMSVGAKVAGFAAMIRVFVTALDNLSDVWVGAVVILATLTLIVGNLLAIAQTNIKRMLAYSSIAHAGFILIAVAASYNNPDGVSAALFYMFAYLFTNLGAF